ncbi:hypothetical protein FDP41_011115 [Naegleria fowleri]|uniref:Uncharacterized protein n=1 Tax=Naegleria fowleri TaxID=5763 RepID=A0A6A5C0Z4_NAEFO|nr:uncharacterized protein FDP41_011115 [Naegleria fowleri]KAF0983137.1 hypothetical protein FDP41_011115 [Naegleria fowleri]
MVFILRKINHYDNCGYIYVHELAKPQPKDSNSTNHQQKQQRVRRSSKTQRGHANPAATPPTSQHNTPFHALSIVSSPHKDSSSGGDTNSRILRTQSLTSNTTTTTTRGDSSTIHSIHSIHQHGGHTPSSRVSSMAISEASDSNSDVLSLNYSGVGFEDRRVTFKDTLRPSSSFSTSSSFSIASAASDSAANNYRKRGKHPVYEIDKNSLLEDTMAMVVSPYSSDLKYLSVMDLNNNNSSKNSKGFLTSLFKTKSRSKFELEVIRQQKNRDNHFQSMIGLLAQLRAVCKVVLEISNDLLGDVNRIGNRIVSLNHRVEASKRKTLFHVTKILSEKESPDTSTKQHDIKFRYNNHSIMSRALMTKKSGSSETDACKVHQKAVDLLHEVKSRMVSNATTSTSTELNSKSSENSVTLLGRNILRELSFSLSVLKPSSNSASQSVTSAARTIIASPLSEKLLTLPEPLKHRYDKRCHKDPSFHPKADAQLIKITTSSTSFKDLQNGKSTYFCSYLHDIDVLKWIHEGHVTKCSQLVSFPDFFRLKWQERSERNSQFRHTTTPRRRTTSCSVSSTTNTASVGGSALGGEESYHHHYHQYHHHTTSYDYSEDTLDEEYTLHLDDTRSTLPKPILLQKKPMRIPRWATMESVFTKYGRDTVGAEFDNDDEDDHDLESSCTRNSESSFTSQSSSTRSSSSHLFNFFQKQKQYPYYVGAPSSSTNSTEDSTYNTATSTSSNLDSCEDWAVNNYYGGGGGGGDSHHSHHQSDTNKITTRFSLRLFGHLKKHKNPKKSKAMHDLIQNQVYGHIARSFEWHDKKHSISPSLSNEDDSDDEISYPPTSIMHINDMYNSRKESRRRFLNALRNYQNSKDLINKLNARRYSHDEASSSSSDSEVDNISSDTCSVVRIPVMNSSRQARPSSIETTVSALSMDFSSFTSHHLSLPLNHVENQQETHLPIKENRNLLTQPPSSSSSQNVLPINHYGGHSHSPYTPSSNPSQSLDSLETSSSETESDISNILSELPSIFETLHQASNNKNRDVDNNSMFNQNADKRIGESHGETMDTTNQSSSSTVERSNLSLSNKDLSARILTVAGERTTHHHDIMVNSRRDHGDPSSTSTAETSSSFSSTTSSSLHSSDIGNKSNEKNNFSPNVVVMVKQILSQEPIRMEPHSGSRRAVVCNADEEDLLILNSLRKKNPLSECVMTMHSNEDYFSDQQQQQPPIDHHQQTTTQEYDPPYEEELSSFENWTSANSVHSSSDSSVAQSFGPITSLTKQVLSEEKLFERVQRSKPLIEIHLANSQQWNKGGIQKSGKHDNNHPMLKRDSKQDDSQQQRDDDENEEYDEDEEYDEEEYSTTDDDKNNNKEQESPPSSSSSNNHAPQKVTIPSLFSLVRGKNKDTPSQTSSMNHQQMSPVNKQDKSPSKLNVNSHKEVVLLSNVTSNHSKELHTSNGTNHRNVATVNTTNPLSLKTTPTKIDEKNSVLRMINAKHHESSQSNKEISNTAKTTRSNNDMSNNSQTTNPMTNITANPSNSTTCSQLLPISHQNQPSSSQHTNGYEQHALQSSSTHKFTMFQDNISQFRRASNHSSSYSTTSSLSSIDDYVINSMVGTHTNHSNRNVLKHAAKTQPPKGNTPSPMFVSNLPSSYEYSMKVMELERRRSTNPISRIMNYKYGEYSSSDEESSSDYYLYERNRNGRHDRQRGTSDAMDDKVYRVAESHQSRYIPSDDESLVLDEDADDDDFDF